jgi:hypothetical protein
VPAVVRRFEEHRLPELVVAAVAGDLDVSHAAAARGGLPGRLAQARRPAHVCRPNATWHATSAWPTTPYGAQRCCFESVA